PAGQLGGEIILPAGPGPHPGVVFLHGAGPQPRDASRFAAYQMAELGVAALIFDKRGVGQSQGESAGASFEDLAEDGVAMARHLESLPQVSDVGFFGHSQGGWIAPLAAMRWPGAAFVITSAGPAVPPSREAHWEFVRNLRTLAAGDAAIEAAREVIDYWHDGVRSGDWRNYDAAVKTLSTKAWFEPAGLHRLPRPPDPAFAAMYLAYMDYDPMPALRALKAPMLALLAPRDESIDALETAGILRALAASGADIHIRMYPGFDHAMRSLGLDGQPLRWPRHPADYFSTQAEFINRAISGR
ncbi:MAG: alpha/beta hydrolase, partial [Gammaproteobacteria bacterium]|nr:alpha/beta hydrolase [Gammaproteobacteria bacterium]